MARTDRPRPNRLELPTNQPLVAVIVATNGNVVTEYSDGSHTDTETEERLQAALRVIGAWKDLEEWHDVVAALDAIRHEGIPTSSFNQ